MSKIAAKTIIVGAMAMAIGPDISINANNKPRGGLMTKIKYNLNTSDKYP